MASRIPRLGYGFNVSARTKGGRVLALFRDTFIEHFGGEPTRMELAVIDIAIQLKYRLLLMEQKFDENDADMSEKDSQRYLAWCNALTRLIKGLGKARAPKSAVSSIDSIVARKAARTGVGLHVRAANENRTRNEGKLDE